MNSYKCIVEHEYFVETPFSNGPKGTYLILKGSLWKASKVKFPPYEIVIYVMTSVSTNFEMVIYKEELEKYFKKID